MAAFPHHHSHYGNGFAIYSDQGYMYPIAPAIAGGLSVGEFEYVQGVYTHTPMYSRYMPPMYFVSYQPQYFVPFDDSWTMNLHDDMDPRVEFWTMNAREGEEESTLTWSDLQQWGSINEGEYPWILNAEAEGELYTRTLEELGLLRLTDREALIGDGLSEEIMNAQEGEEESTLSLDDSWQWDPIDEYPWILNDETEGERYMPTLEELGHWDLTDREARVGDGLSEETVTSYLNSRNLNPLVNATDICVVCQDCLFQKEETVATLDCGHAFHTGCIKTWLMVKNCCPLCKAKGIRL